MNDGQQDHLNSHDGGTYVAPLLPPTAQPPEPLQKRLFVSDVLLYWLVPHRRGPHLAARSFRRAWFAHLLVYLFIVVLFGLHSLHEFNSQPYQEVTFENFRYVIADTILLSAENARYNNWSDFNILNATLLVIVSLPMIQIVLLVIGTVAMPFAAGGDRAWSVWKRSVKNAYWSTTVLVPITIMVWLMHFLHSQKVFALVLSSSDWLVIGIQSSILLGILILIGLWVRALIVGAGRYIGEVDGPAWSEREPQCDDCGYPLIHLPLDSRCPECGLLVSASLPGGRRQPTAWSRNEMKMRGFLDLLRMQKSVLRDPEFMKSIPVQNMLGPARHFWWATYLVMTFCMMMLGLIVTALCGLYRTSVLGLPMNHEPIWWTYPFLVSMLTFPLPFLLMMIANLPMCLTAQWQQGIQDYRVSAAACFYSAPLLWPLYVSCFVLTSFCAISTAITGETMYFIHIQYLPLAILTYLLVIPVLWSFWFWLRRIDRAMNCVRFANV